MSTATLTQCAACGQYVAKPCDKCRDSVEKLAEAVKPKKTKKK